MLAFPSYNYEGSFKLEQVVELKSAYGDTAEVEGYCEDAI